MSPQGLKGPWVKKQKFILGAPLKSLFGEEDFEQTLADLRKLFESLQVLPTNPVIVLGKYLQQYIQSNTILFPPHLVLMLF
jgi:hypothetical protein